MVSSKIRSHAKPSKAWTRRWLAWSAAILVGSTGLVAYSHEQSTDNWLSYGRSWNEQRFSPLTQINSSTIKDLGLAWSIELPASARGLQGTPLAIDGVLYFTTSLSVVYAVDAATGKELWRYDPEVGNHNPRSMRTSLGVNRGLAYSDGALFIGALDGRLISIDLKTGKPRWIVKTLEGSDARSCITGAPRVFKGKVIIGNCGADFGTRGYVTAYDEKTGAQRWRFYTVPGDPAKGFEDETQAMAAKTWGGQWWRWGGGGTVWNAMTFDPEFNRIYIGTGNAANYNSDMASPGGGDQLFLSSIVALDADSGKYVWHYQVNPRESWDFKATADMILADLKIDGKQRKVLMQAPTNGFFYVLDRQTGKLLSAEKLGKVTWAERIDLKTGRPVEAKNIRYEKGSATFWPSPQGVHNWQPMSFNPQTGLVYVPTMKMPALYNSTAQDRADAEVQVVGSRRYWLPIGAGHSAVKIDPDDGTGALVAWDPVAQKPRWTVRYPSAWNGGTLTTAANLVFDGTADGFLHARDGTTGKELWRGFAGNGIIAPPITYSVKGKQYVTVLAGYLNIVPGSVDPGWRHRKHPPRVVTFMLGGKAKLPPIAPRDGAIEPVHDPREPIDAAMAARGFVLWNRSCASCHGGGAQSTGVGAPDLRESAAAQDFDTLRAIVHDGALALGGMPVFDEYSDAELRDIRMYIREVSRDAATGRASVARGDRAVGP